VPVTLTLRVHDPLAATVPPDRLIVPLPATAVGVPPQKLLKPLGVATTNPAGKVSLKATPRAETLVLGFVMVKVKVETPLSGIVVGLNALLIVGGATTVTLAVAVFPVPPLVEVTVTELFLTPAVVPKMLMLKAHSIWAACVTPVILIVPEPAVAVIVPPSQGLVKPLGVATTKPAGRVSVNATPVRVGPPVGLRLLTEKVRVVVPLSGIVAAPNALLIVGGRTTCAKPTRLTAKTKPSTRNATRRLSFFTLSPSRNRKLW